jgi:glycosyltransferase involved in cell wall biosynthesis
MKVSVIIPVYRDWDMLQNCLNHLSNQSYPKDTFEIIIVNNDQDSVPPQNFIFPSNSTIVIEAIPGSYAARNTGIMVATSEIIAFTDSDCRPDTDWIEQGVRALSRGYDMIGGKVELFKEPDGEELAFIYESRFGFNQKRNVAKGQSVTANLFCTSGVIEKSGKFNQNILSGGDFEWTKRATSSGFKMGYGAEVRIKHPARKCLQQLITKKKRTIGGMHTRFFKSFNAFQKLKFTLHMLRPHITIFNYKGLTFKKRVQLFFATWYVECIGMKEMLLLDFNSKKAERS